MTDELTLRASLRHLRTPVSGRRFAGKLALCAGLTAGGGLLALRPEPWCEVVGTLLLGLMFAHAAELQHEALHHLGFRGRRANARAGIVLGLPLLVSYAAYRASHLRHHRDLGTPQNREFFDYAGADQYGTADPVTRPVLAARWAIRFLMLHHFASFGAGLLATVRGRDFAGETALTSRRIRRDHWVALAALAALAGLSLMLGQALLLRLWLAPLMLVAAPVHAAVELPEHYRCRTLDRDPFRNTRSIRSNRLMTWFTNGNNFHVEHHLMPGLPIVRLPDLHAEIRDRIEYFEPGYRDFYRGLLTPSPTERT